MALLKLLLEQRDELLNMDYRQLTARTKCAQRPSSAPLTRSQGWLNDMGRCANPARHLTVTVSNTESECSILGAKIGWEDPESEHVAGKGDTDGAAINPVEMGQKIDIARASYGCGRLGGRIGRDVPESEYIGKLVKMTGEAFSKETAAVDDKAVLKEFRRRRAVTDAHSSALPEGFLEATHNLDPCNFDANVGEMTLSGLKKPSRRKFQWVFKLATSARPVVFVSDADGFDIRGVLKGDVREVSTVFVAPGKRSEATALKKIKRAKECGSWIDLHFLAEAVPPLVLATLKTTVSAHQSYRCFVSVQPNQRATFFTSSFIMGTPALPAKKMFLVNISSMLSTSRKAPKHCRHLHLSMLASYDRSCTVAS